MEKMFTQSFLKTAKVLNLLNTIPKSARGVGAVDRMSRGVGEIATQQASRKAVQKAAPKPFQDPTPGMGSSHTEYLRSIGAIGKTSKNADQVIKYKPSTTQVGKSKFDSISPAPKTPVEPGREPLK